MYLSYLAGDGHGGGHVLLVEHLRHDQPRDGACGSVGCGLELVDGGVISQGREGGPNRPCKQASPPAPPPARTQPAEASKRRPTINTQHISMSKQPTNHPPK